MSQVFASGGRSIGFSFNIGPSSEYSGLISFRMDWLDILEHIFKPETLIHIKKEKEKLIVTTA